MLKGRAQLFFTNPRIIEFIKLVAKEGENARQASHFINFPKLVY